jgi:L-lactate dehydrogenase
LPANGLACSDQTLQEIFTKTRDAAYQIIERKGATYYAIGAGLLRIVEAILRDQNTVLSISSFLTDYYGISDVCLSLPSVVDRDGVERVLKLELNELEMKGLMGSARLLKDLIPQLGL